MADRPRRDERRGLDPLALLFGVGALMVSGIVLTDDSGLLPGLDPRWLFAGGAVFVGMLMLAGALRRPRDHDEP